MPRLILLATVIIALAETRHMRGLSVATPYIIGGGRVSITAHPHQVSVQNRWGGHMCGGAIIAPTKVVSAAHCTQHELKFYKIRAGSSDWTRGGQERLLRKISNHPKYCRRCHNGDNDISVLTVSKAFSYSSSVQPIELAQDSDFDGETCTITGWGRASPSFELPEYLQGARIGVLSNSQCLQELNSFVKPSMICVVDKSHRVSSCSGDSGGPLVCRGMLAGVSSTGIKRDAACVEDRPAAYMRISSYISWILDQ